MSYEIESNTDETGLKVFFSGGTTVDTHSNQVRTGSLANVDGTGSRTQGKDSGNVESPFHYPCSS